MKIKKIIKKLINKYFFIKLLQNFFNKFGISIISTSTFEKLINLAHPPIKETDFQLLMSHQNLLAGFDDLDPSFKPIMNSVKSFTMTSTERMFDLYKTIEYLVRADIPGDIVECGVWRGGSMMLVAKTLLLLKDTNRTLYCFDTFEGHPKPDSTWDIDLWGNNALDEWRKYQKKGTNNNWGFVSIDEVQRNMESTGYPKEKIVLIKGRVENTAASLQKKALSLVRLDTDWHASTKVGLEEFWPKISNGGMLIVDDYGHYKGQRKAVDEFFEKNPVMMHRIDYSCRSILKIENEQQL